MLAEISSPQNSTVAVGENGTISCTSSSDDIIWQVSPRSDGELETYSYNPWPRLTQEPEALDPDLPGFFISLMSEGAGTFVSALTLEGNLVNNFTEVKCYRQMGNSQRLRFPRDLEAGVLQVYGKLVAAF